MKFTNVHLVKRFFRSKTGNLLLIPKVWAERIGINCEMVFDPSTNQILIKPTTLTPKNKRTSPNFKHNKSWVDR